MPFDDNVPITRPSLILRLRNRADMLAWQEFVEIYQPVISGVAKKRGLQDADVNDIVQEVLTRVAKSVGTWDPDPEKGTFRGWLATITRNVVVQAFRESKRRPVTGIDAVTSTVPSDFEGRLSGEFATEQERQLFLWAAQKIRPRFAEKTWQAFWLTAVEGRSVDSAAKELASNKSQIYVSRSRIMSVLKQTIEESGFDLQPGIGRRMS